MKSVSPESPAVAHGLGLFETMLVRRGQVFQLEEHFRRLAASAHALQFPLPAEKVFRDAIGQAAGTVANLDEAALRCLYIATGKELAAGRSWQLLATTGPIPATTLRRRKGARVITLDRSLSRSLPGHKLTSYAASVVGLRMAIAAGADEGLFVDGRGAILEGTATNVFAMDGAKLITTPVRAGILPGIVRAWVLEHAAGAGLEVIERKPTVAELRRGSFLTSSLTTLAPIVRIDGLPCARPGSFLARLRRRFRVESS
jgi:branched-subunit amino acid aminotransferase/4-amino-4-deoxychorismate lyase